MVFDLFADVVSPSNDSSKVLPHCAIFLRSEKKFLDFVNFILMPANRNALIRYKTIDQCLQNRYRKWTLEDLIDACSDALYEFEGIDKGVSRRTVQADIQLMRSDKLGYNAPIIVVDKKYYTYEERDYSITNIPLTDQDLKQLNDSVMILKQFKGFSHFRELDGVIQKLEDHVYVQHGNNTPIIDFEKNENLKGLEYLDQLYQAILKKQTIELTYQSFKARKAASFVFHPYLLKEFRNRWFVIGRRGRDQALFNLALDRIADLQTSNEDYIENSDFDPTEYYKNVIGVSASPNVPVLDVVLFVSREHAPYVQTKPLHPSQEIVSQDHYGITISLKVQHNFELEKDILAFGDGIKVIEPVRLRRNIQDRIQGAIDRYETELSDSGVKKAIERLDKNGFSILNRVYTTREVRQIRSALHKVLFSEERKTNTVSRRRLFLDFPKLLPMVLNENLMFLIKSIDRKAFLSKAIFFDKQPESNWYVTWHQDQTINVQEKVETEGYDYWTQKDDVVSVIPPEELLHNTFTLRIHLDETDASNGSLNVVAGSHKKRLSDQEIKTITSNSAPYDCAVDLGGVHLMRPLLLHRSAKTMANKRRRVIHLEFTSYSLPRAASVS